MTTKQPCTIEHLKTSLNYDPNTGVFIWLRNDRRPDLVGRIAGSKQAMGYWAIAVHNKKVLAHRLAWLYETGVWPAKHIDHMNGDKLDNRFVNLREVSRYENLQNMRKPTKANKSGFLGVSAHQGKWRAQICANGKYYRKSGFDTPEEAHEYYLHLKRRLHKSCTI